MAIGIYDQFSSNGIRGILNNIWFGTGYSKNLTNSFSDIVFGNKFDISNPLEISTVYTCIRILSGVISRLPLNIMREINGERVVVKDDYRYNLLHNSPDGIRTSNKYMAVLETQRNLFGNSFAKIHRISGNPVKLEFIDQSRVIDYTILDEGVFYKIRRRAPENEDIIDIVKHTDLLHFTSIVTRDGIWGVNPIESLRKILSISHKALTTIDTFYDNNATGSRAIKSSISIQGNVKQDAFLESVAALNEKYAGYTKAGKLLPLPPNTEIQELSINFKDAEFIATIKFTKQDIGSLYGVPPSTLGLFEASKFNNVEQMMLDFTINNLADILRMYRQEKEFKLLKPEEKLNGWTIEFEDKGLLATDYKTRLESYKTLFGIASMTPNQVLKQEGLSSYPDGNKHYIASNFVAVEDNNSENKEIIKRNEDFTEFILRDYHNIPEAEQDWIYMIHHIHKPKKEGAMEEVHHCTLWSEKDEKGDSFEIKHVKDNKVFQHALDIKDLEKAPENVYDHLNNKYPVKIKEIDKVKYAIINKPNIKIKHDD